MINTFNNVPAFHTFKKSAEQLEKNGFRFDHQGTANNGATPVKCFKDRRGYIAFVYRHSTNRYEVATYKITNNLNHTSQ